MCNLKFQKTGKENEEQDPEGKLDTLSDEMPEILENANAANLAHAKSLDKWQNKIADVMSLDREE